MAFPLGYSAPSLSPWQMQFNGLTFGAGTAYEIVGIQGVSDLPMLNTGDVARARVHGEFPGYNLLAGRDIDVSLDLGFKNGALTSQVLLKNLQVAINANLTNTVAVNAELPLWIQIPNRPVMGAMVRIKDAKYPYTFDYANSGRITPELWFHATDPRFYGNPVSTTQSFSSATTASIPTITYAGDVDMNPIVTFASTSTGMSNVTVTCTVGGVAQWKINLEPGTVPTATTYVIDTDLHTITKAGSAYYSASATAPTWPNPISLVGGMMTSSSKSAVISASWTGSGNGSLKVDYAPAYLA